MSYYKIACLLFMFLACYYGIVRDWELWRYWMLMCLIAEIGDEILKRLPETQPEKAE